MNRQDVSEMFLWAAGAAIIGMAVLSASLVNSEDVPAPPISPAATIDGFSVTAAVTPDPLNHEAVVGFQMPPAIAGKAATVRVAVELRKREFTGNPVSRVMNPNDFKITTVDEATVTLKTNGRKPAETQWRVAVPKPVPSQLMVTYQVAAVQGEEKVVLCVFSPVSVWPELATDTEPVALTREPAVFTLDPLPAAE